MWLIVAAMVLAASPSVNAAPTLEERMKENRLELPPDAQQVVNEMNLTAVIGQDFVNAATGKTEFIIVLYGNGKTILALAVFHYAGAWCSCFCWQEKGITRWKTYRRKVKIRGQSIPPPF